MTRLTVLLLTVTCFALKFVWCQDPEVKLEALSPKGLRVTVPDNGYSYLTFYGKLNEDIYDVDDTDWFKNITYPTDGQWVFRDRNLKLELGDVIYYGTSYGKDGEEIESDIQTWNVTEFVDATLLSTVRNPSTNAGAAQLGYDTRPYSNTQTSTQRSTYAVKLPPSEYLTQPVSNTQTSTQPSAYAIKPHAPAYDVRPYTRTQTTQPSAYAIKPHAPAYDVRPYTGTQTSTQQITSTPKCKDSATINRGQNSACGDNPPLIPVFDKAKFIQDVNKWVTQGKFLEQPFYPFNTYTPEFQMKFESGAYVDTPGLTEQNYNAGFITYGDLDLTKRCSGKMDQKDCVPNADGAGISPPVKDPSKQVFAFKYGKLGIKAALPPGVWLLPDIANAAASQDSLDPNSTGASFSNSQVSNYDSQPYVDNTQTKAFPSGRNPNDNTGSVYSPAYKVRRSPYDAQRIPSTPKAEDLMTIVERAEPVSGGSLNSSEELYNNASVKDSTYQEEESKTNKEANHSGDETKYTKKFENGTSVVTPVRP